MLDSVVLEEVSGVIDVEDIDDVAMVEEVITNAVVVVGTGGSGKINITYIHTLVHILLMHYR